MNGPQFGKETIRCIVQNDPALNELRLGNFYLGEVGMFRPRDELDLAKLGGCIRKSQHLKGIKVDSFPAIDCMMATTGGTSFLEGIKSNMTIQELQLSNCSLSEGIGQQLLTAINKMNFTSISLWRCALDDERTHDFVSTLLEFQSLENLSIHSSFINDDIVVDLIQGLELHHHSLKTLRLGGGSMGERDAVHSLRCCKIQNPHF